LDDYQRIGALYLLQQNDFVPCKDPQVFTTAKFKACEQQWKYTARGYLSFNIAAQPLYSQTYY